MFVIWALLLLLFATSADAQTIGVIITSNVPYYQEMHDAFAAKLSKEGLDKVKFIVQRPYPDPVSWGNAARKILAADVDIIVTYGAPATLAVLKERPSIPVVYAGVYEPAIADKKLKNSTGVVFKLPITSIIRYLKSTTNITKLGVIYCNVEEDSLKQLEEIKAVAPRHGLTVKEINIRRANDVTTLLPDAKIDALFITTSSLIDASFDFIVKNAKSRKIPTGSFHTVGGYAALITLEAAPKEQGQKAAEKTIEILRGKPAGSIPQSSATDVDLIVNMKDAREMNLRISVDLMTEATKIISNEPHNK